MLEKYEEILAEPSELPPDPKTNHNITLVAGLQPVNVHPYRYPHYQKNEIENMTNEMLHQRLIHHNISPFSFPVLLVKKKNGSWRFCIDYRALNAIIIRDRFPIPTMDELMDELHGTVIFSKLNLRAGLPGYHQIWIANEDVHKTAFRTHLGHYEFTVMPFGL